MERYEKYNFDELANYYSGPDAIMLTDELTQNMTLTKDMTVLDLGCGNALSSLFLAKEYGCTVYAVDPKSSSSKNYDFAKAHHIEDKLIPFCATASALPFEHQSFDSMISIDAWQAFGTEAGFFTTKIAPLLKPNAEIGIVVPGSSKTLSKEQNLDQRDVLATFWSAERWGKYFDQEFNVTKVEEMKNTVEAWKRWYRASSPAARKDPTAKWNIGNGVAIIMVIGRLR